MREYELVLMLDPGQDAPGRDAVAGEAKAMIEASGALKHENAWGLRKLAYEIEKRNEADYRWFRFEAPTELLEQLDHSLKIADGVLRFRVFRVDADTPVMVPPAAGAPAAGASRERPDAAAPAAPTPPPAEAPPAAEPEPAAAPPEPAAEAETPPEPPAPAEAPEAPAEPEPPAAPPAPGPASAEAPEAAPEEGPEPPPAAA